MSVDNLPDLLCLRFGRWWGEEMVTDVCFHSGQACILKSFMLSARNTTVARPFTRAVAVFPADHVGHCHERLVALVVDCVTGGGGGGL